MDARNMHRSEINILSRIVHLVGFIFKNVSQQHDPQLNVIQCFTVYIFRTRRLIFRKTVVTSTVRYNICLHVWYTGSTTHAHLQVEDTMKN